MEGDKKIANIQNPADYTSIEPKLELIDRIREETLDVISNYLKKMGAPFDDLPAYLRKPAIYHGTSIGLKQITEWFIDLTISKYYKKIQKKKLTIKYVINAVRENILQGGWDPKRHSNIILATRGVNKPQKVVNTNEKDEAPRSLIVKNNGHKIESKSNSNIIAKKKKKPIVRKKAAEKKEPTTEKKPIKKGSCEYCSGKVKFRANRNNIHINISQNPAHHRFCSKECKTMWIYDLINGRIFRTWDEFCLDKLKEIGKASLTKWAIAMDFKNSASMSRTAQYLEEKGKIKVIHTKSSMIKKYYEAI